MPAHDPVDFCIIGAGSAGLSVAAAASQFGQSVVLIEKAKMGGDCLNYGCVPSKALIAAAKHAHAFNTGEAFGVAPATPRIDFAKVHDHIHDVIAAIAPHDSQERFEGMGVKVIRSPGHFIDPETVAAGGEKIRARRFVIATGSSPSAPPIPGLDTVPYLTNETIFDNTELPKQLIIIGAGPIGIEMAQAHARLGSKVTVLEAFDPLAKDDPELTRIVLDHVRREGVEILSRIKITEVRSTKAGVTVDIEFEDEHRAISGSHLLVAAGRKANVENLGLDNAGIEFTPKGIVVDKGLRTTNRKVYAIGDVAGGLQFTHVAGYHAGLVIRNALFRLPVNNETRHIPWVTYTDPELAHVGMTEDQAKQQGQPVKVLRWSYQENDRAQAERRTDGLVKVITSAKGHILGASIVGRQAGELIQPWCLAITQKQKIKSMIDQVVAYPTLGEINRRAAMTYYSDLPKKPLVRTAIKLLKIFG